MTFVWLLFLVDQLGRRNLLLIGGITGSICMWVIGSYVYIVEPTEHPQDHLTGSGIAAIVFFYLWTAVYTPTWNGTPWVINSVSTFRPLPLGSRTRTPLLTSFPIGILRSKLSFPGPSLHNCEQLALQLSRLSLRGGHVCGYGIRRLHVLRHAILFRLFLCLLPHS